MKTATLLSSDAFDAPARKRPSLAPGIRGKLKHLLGIKSDASLKDVLEEAIEEHEESSEQPLPPQEKILLHNMLGVGDITVSDIMVHRSAIAAVPTDISLADLIKHLMEVRHTRIPVYEDTPDHMLGFIHLKDMLPHFAGARHFDLKALLRPLIFVPASMRIIDLLVKMRHAGSHMAIVVDEYGGTDGLVTMEDVFEEIVGDIQDEHDGEEDQPYKIVPIDASTYEVDAAVPIERLEKQLGMSLVGKDQAEAFDTVGGFIFYELGRVPAVGEMIEHASGTRFEIISADARRIQKIRITLKS